MMPATVPDGLMFTEGKQQFHVKGGHVLGEIPGGLCWLLFTRNGYHCGLILDRLWKSSGAVRA